LKKIVTFSANTSWYLYNFRKNTISLFISKNYEVICLSPRDKYTPLLEDLGCQFREISTNNKRVNLISEFKYFMSIFTNYLALRPAVSFHFTIKNNIYGTISAFLLGIRSVNNISGLGTAFIHRGFKYLAIRALYKVTMPLSFKVFCQNTEDLKWLQSIPFLKKQKIELIPGSGVDINRFNPSLMKTNIYSANPLKFIYVGRFLADKGLNELVQAISVINNESIRCELVLLGFERSENISSISLDQINEWSQLPGISLLQSTDTVENELAYAHCLVLPSYREGLSKSILEACAMGIPVITTDVPGCRDVVLDEYNGLLCKPANTLSLIGALEKMLSMKPKEIEVLGRNARELVEQKYDERIVINHALKVVQDANL